MIFIDFSYWNRVILPFPFYDVLIIVRILTKSNNGSMMASHMLRVYNSCFKMESLVHPLYAGLDFIG